LAVYYVDFEEETVVGAVAEMIAAPVCGSL
jgi:hypothetical protein